MEQCSHLFIIPLLNVRHRGELVIEMRRRQLEQSVSVMLLQGGLLLHKGPDVLQKINLLAVLGLELGQLVLVQGLDVLGVGALAGHCGRYGESRPLNAARL